MMPHLFQMSIKIKFRRVKKVQNKENEAKFQTAIDSVLI